MSAEEQSAMYSWVTLNAWWLTWVVWVGLLAVVLVAMESVMARRSWAPLARLTFVVLMPMMVVMLET